MRRLFGVTALVALMTMRAWGAGEGATFDQAVLPFINDNCIRCHGEKKQKGDFRLDQLPRDFATDGVAQRWAEVMFRINAAEMPPKKEPQPSPDAIGHVVGWISARLDEGRAARMAARGPVAIYRLSRDEYANTVNDLLGVFFDVNLPGAFNDDPRWHGFERIGSMLSISPSHVDKYFKAAETVLDRAFPEHPSKPVKMRRDVNQGREKWLADHGISGRVRWPLWPSSKRDNALSITEPGNYRVRIQLSGLSPTPGRAPHLSLWNQQLKRSVFDQDIIAPEDKPIIVEFEIALSASNYDVINEVPAVFSEVGNHTLNVLNGGGSVFTSSKNLQTLNPTGYQLFDDDGNAIYPTLILDWVEWEGPLTSEADLKKRAGLIPAKDDLSEARDCLQRLATRAWRRPATDAEVSRYMKIMDAEQAAGENFRSAYRAAMVGILTSKNFYYLQEGSPTQRRDKINDWELAARLSYFLWGSMPDDELFALAQAGTLHEPQVLRRQIARMFADCKINRFTDAFPRQWLQLYKVGMFPPDPKLYPDYDKWLEQCMLLEPVAYFTEMFAKNLPLRQFLVSDWTMVNPRLALHYQLPPLNESGFTRVTLRPEDHRGGLLTQAGVLMLTSDGTRHRPVHRGVWVSEVVFGTTPPPPPPNVQPIEPTPSDKPKATVRMQLEAHATNPTCASCHNKIDPLGLAFDNYDAIGRWRTEEIVPTGKGANPPVDASGTLPDGRAFTGPDDFKQLLAQGTDHFADAFVGQLATFALRRVMTVDDAAQIKAIAQASKKDDYQLRTLIENLVMSDLFQKR